MSQLVPSTTPLRTFEDHESIVTAVAVFAARRRMITGLDDKTLRIWDLETGVVLEKMEGHSREVKALAVSRDDQIIASGDNPIKVHSSWINSVDFSPDGLVLATGSRDGMTKFWCSKTWQMQGEPIDCSGVACCIRYSSSGELLASAIATFWKIQVYNPGTIGERFQGSHKFQHVTRVDTYGTRLLSGGDDHDSTIREWDSSTWQQVGHPWEGHTSYILANAIDPTGTLIASASGDKHVRLWRLSDRQNVGFLVHSSAPRSVTFSMDGRHILSGGYDNKISEWEVPN